MCVLFRFDLVTIERGVGEGFGRIGFIGLERCDGGITKQQCVLACIFSIALGLGRLTYYYKSHYALVSIVLAMNSLPTSLTLLLYLGCVWSVEPGT